MSIRLTIAIILTVFMIPVGQVYFSMPDVPPAVAMYGFLSYVVLIGYLIATGFNLKNKGKPW